ncbi:MAG: hypothetical protein Q9M20_01040 [Mariprofundaceae bacterium]|nr:hypothetical protein [Mariprofundaceae bacterium]
MKDLSEYQGIKWETVAITDLPSCTPEESSSAWLRDGDIIFTARGKNNYAVETKQCLPNTVLSPHLFLIRIKDTSIISPAFLRWQISQKTAQRYFVKSAECSSVIGIRRKILEDLPIFIPALEEQRETVNVINGMEKQRNIMQELQVNHLNMMETIAYKLLSRPASVCTSIAQPLDSLGLLKKHLQDLGGCPRIERPTAKPPFRP